MLELVAPWLLDLACLTGLHRPRWAAERRLHYSAEEWLRVSRCRRCERIVQPLPWDRGGRR